MDEANKALHADQSLNTFQRWKEAYEVCNALNEEHAQQQPTDTIELENKWMNARDEALEALAQDAGLRLRTDL